MALARVDINACEWDSEMNASSARGYSIGAKLGQGIYGQVARGRMSASAVSVAVSAAAASTASSSVVAVKRMDSIFKGGRYSRDSLVAYREMHILRHLRHPNVIRLHDVALSTIRTSAECAALIEAEAAAATSTSVFLSSHLNEMRKGNMYLVFDFMDTDLDKIVKDFSQHLTTEQIARLLHQILCGLKYIHSANVIHRDLKPANILISCADVGARIADFGLSRVVLADETRSDYPAHPAPDRPPPESESGPGKEEEEEGGGGGGEAGIGVSATTDPPTTSSESLGPALVESQGGGGGGEGGEIEGSIVPLRRQFSQHVVTRWYRAPEIVLSLPYTGSADVWSVGCIFAELLSTHRDSFPHPTIANRRPLFPGNACGELSPQARSGKFGGSRDEQLDLIFALIGTPSPNETRDLNQATKDFIYEHCSLPVPPTVAEADLGTMARFKARFVGASDEALSLLIGLLRFSPDKRFSIEDALAHPFLAKAKGREEEGRRLDFVCAKPLNGEIEALAESKQNLLKEVVKEIQLYRERDQREVTSGCFLELAEEAESKEAQAEGGGEGC